MNRRRVSPLPYSRERRRPRRIFFFLKDVHCLFEGTPHPLQCYVLRIVHQLRMKPFLKLAESVYRVHGTIPQSRD